ncbi:MAG: EamA family transporter [Burkholderiales bacterium]
MGLSFNVTLAVLAAALMHAAWNAIVKSGGDKLLDTTAMAAGAGVIAALCLPFLPLPHRASWPWLAASVVLHAGYFWALISAYRHGDLSTVYPLMRGLAPLLTTAAAYVLIGEAPGRYGVAGIALISAGILLPVALGRHGNRRAQAYAMANAVVIMAYSVTDGLGARASGNAASYVLWIFFLNAFPLTALALLRRGPARVGAALLQWRPAVVGAALTIGSYGIVLWAMTVAPVAAVAALRETSVIFAALIGAWLLKEPFGPPRIAGAVLVAAGVLLLRV